MNQVLERNIRVLDNTFFNFIHDETRAEERQCPVIASARREPVTVIIYERR